MKEKLIPFYYKRNQIEKIYETCRQERKTLPLIIFSDRPAKCHQQYTAAVSRAAH